MSGQSIMDRVVAAKHSIAGQGLAKIVCKATTEEVMGPKKKHLDYLLQCTNEPNVSIPQLADLLIERTQQANWVVAFKGLITIHNLMNYGNERFTQYLASNNCTFNLGSFLDKQGVQGYDMSKFIRKYSTYMNEKAVSYRAMAFDFCKVKRGKDDGLLRTMATEKLLKALPVLQKQLDALLEFDCTPNELTNGVVNACFMLLFKDLIRLFACYNDGIINLLEKYFDMNKKQCKEALDIYKKFLVRMDRVSEFLKVAENVGIDKGDIPDLAKGMKTNSKDAPASLLDALEQHLNALEGKKGVTTPTTKPAGFATAIDTISSNSSVQVSDEEVKRILEEEKVKLRELKLKGQKPVRLVDMARMGPANWEQHFEQAIDLTIQDQRLKEISITSPTTSPQNQPPASNNPFVTTQGSDLFRSSAHTPVTNSTGKASDDLLNLTGNPFVESVQSVMTMNSQNTFATPAWGSTNAAGGSFTSDADFAKVFQNSNSTMKAALDVSTTVTAAQPIQSSPVALPKVPFGIEDSLDSMASVGQLGARMGPLPLSTSPIPIGGASLSGAFGVSSLSSSPGPVRSPLMARTFGAPPLGTSPGGMGGGFGAPPFGTSPGGMGGGFGAPPLGTSPGGLTGGFAELGMTMLHSPANFGRTSPIPSSGSDPGSGFDAFGDVLQPVSTQPKSQTDKAEKAIKGDLDSSLANLAGNLHMDGPASQVKKTHHEWQPKSDTKKTGGSNWAPQPITSNTSWASGFGPTPTGMAMAPQPVMSMGPQPGMVMGPQPGMVMAPGMTPGMYGAPAVSMGMGTTPQPQPPVTQPTDPFGAL